MNPHPQDPAGRAPLCRLDELPDPGSRGFRIAAPGGPLEMFVVRRGETVRGYVNRCPHTGLGLDIMPHRFLDADGVLIVCATHGALFRIEDGFCVAGPCAGDCLQPVAVQVRGGQVVLAGG